MKNISTIIGFLVLTVTLIVQQLQITKLNERLALDEELLIMSHNMNEAQNNIIEVLIDGVTLALSFVGDKEKKESPKLERKGLPQLEQKRNKNEFLISQKEVCSVPLS